MIDQFVNNTDCFPTFGTKHDWSLVSTGVPITLVLGH